MKVFVVSRLGADSTTVALETDKFGNIEIPDGFSADTTHNLYGDADSQSPTFRLFRVIPERALANSRKVMGRNDKHQLMADELPLPATILGVGTLSDPKGTEDEPIAVGGDTPIVEDVFVPEDASKGELIAIAEGLGVHTVPDSMTVDDLKDAIEDADKPTTDPATEPEPVAAKPKKKATKKAAASVPPPDKGKKKSPK